MEDKITEKQLNFIQKLYRDGNISEEKKAEMLKRFSAAHTNELTKMQASQLIDEMAGAPKEGYTDTVPLTDVFVQRSKPNYLVAGNPISAEIEESQEIVQLPQVSGGMVRPLVSPDAAVAVWHEYELLKQKVVTKDDLQAIQGKDYIKKSGWRKLAAFFNLSDEICEEVKEQTDKGFLWRIKVKTTAPNGRTSVGVGVCSSDERNFAHKEHDVYATAHTRAKNRSISDMIGGGAVSAEEIDG